MEDDFELIDISEEAQPQEVIEEPGVPQGIPETIEEDGDFELVDISEEGFSTDPIGDQPTYKSDAVTAELRESRDLDMAMERSRGDLAHSLQVTQGFSPKEAREVERIAKESNLPGSLVRDRMEESRYVADYNNSMNILMKRKDNGELKYPKTNKWMADPNNMAFAKTEFQNLTEIEKIKFDKEHEDDAWYEDIGRQVLIGSANLGKSLGDVPALAYQIAALPFNAASDLLDVPELRIDTPKWIQNNVVSEYYEKSVEQFADARTAKSPIDQIWNKGEIGKGSYNILLQAVSNLPVLATMAMGGIAGLAQKTTLTGMGAIAAGPSLKAGLEEGKTPFAATSGAIGAGSAEAFFEIYTLGVFSNMLKISGKELVKTVGKDSAKKIMFQNVKAMAKGFGLEGSSEAATTLAQNLSDYVTGSKDAMSGTTEQMVNSFLIGGVIGAGMQGITQGRQHAMQAKYLSDQQEQFEKITKLLEGSQLREDAPEKMEEFITEVVGDESMFIPLDSIELFQKAKRKEGDVVDEKKDKEEVAEILKDLGVDAQLDEVKLNGQELEVSKAKFLTKFAGTEFAEAIKENIRYGIDGVTSKESKDIKSEVAGYLKETQDKIRDKASDETIERVDKFRETLMVKKDQDGQGYTAEEADMTIGLLMAGAARAEAERGGGAKEFLDRHQVSLESGGVYEPGQTKRTKKPVEKLVEREVKDLDGDALELANSYIQDSLNEIINEIEGAVAGKQASVGYGIDRKDISQKSTFPAYFAEIGAMAEGNGRKSKAKKKNKKPSTISKAAFLKAARSGKGVVFERIKALAIERLKSGSENSQGRTEPNEEFRALLNLEKSGYGGVAEDLTTEEAAELEKDGIPFDLFQKVKTEKDLFVVHNLTSENLNHAFRVGGLAVPSLAVTKKGKALENFGGITLIAKPGILKSKGAKTFNADVYSPRYPSVEYSVPKAGRNKYEELVKKANEEIFNDTVDINLMENRGVRALQDDASLMYTFLESKGIKPDVVYESIESEKVEAYKEAGFEKYFGGKGMLDSQNEEFVKLAKAFHIKELGTKIEKEDIDYIKESLEDSRGHYLDKVLYSIKTDMGLISDTQNVDTYETRSNIKHQVLNDTTLRGEFDEYASEVYESLNVKEKLFKGFTPSGDRKHVEHSLKNVVTMMKKELRDGEGFNYGIGSIRSTAAKQFKSVAEIARDRNKIVSKEEFEQIKEEADREFGDLFDTIQAETNHYDGWGSMDLFSEHLKEVAETNINSLDQYFELSDTTKQSVVDFLDKLKNMETEYFESKVQRAVEVNEFTAAIVPGNTSDDIVAKLKIAGLEVVKYDESSDTSRQEVMSEYLETTKEEVLFQKQNKKSIEILNKDSLGYYSKLENDVAAMDFKSMPAKNLKSRLAKDGLYKADELEATGILEYLDTFEGKVEKEEVVEYLKNNGLKFEEVTLGGEGTQFEMGADIFDVFTEDGDHMGAFSDHHEAERAVERFMGDGQQALLDLEALEDERDLNVGEVKRLEELRADKDSYSIQVGEFDGQTIEDLEEGGESGMTKYGAYTLPGGENYREVLLTLPNRDGQEFSSGHFDESNILTHFRLNDRVDSTGAKTLFIEEVQSDWHQAGKKQGYKNNTSLEETEKKKEIYLDAALKWKEASEEVAAAQELYQESEEFKGKYIRKIREKVTRLNTIDDQLRDREDPATPQESASLREEQKKLRDERDELERLEYEDIREHRKGLVKDADLDSLSEKSNVLRDSYDKSLGGIPNAPFKQTEAWVMLAFKRILDMAVEQGYDSVSWTPGEVQIERYDSAVSAQVSEIKYKKFGDKYALFLKGPGGGEVASPQESYTESELENVLGKEIATKIVEDKGVDNTLDSVNLKMGGKGMIDIYDKMMPKAIGKYIGKLDKTVKVDSTKTVDTGDGSTQGVWSVEITDKIKESVTQGQTLFQDDGGDVKGLINFQDGKALIKLFKSADKSSALHEMGHLFLKDLQMSIEEGGASEQRSKDLETLLKFADGNFDVEGIEKVVRGFETYLREGKAPSVGLRDAFRTFKSWLVNIYKSIKDLPEINDDVRAVFDRMLASEEQIAEASEQQDQKESLAELLDAPKKVKADLEEKKKKVQKTAEEILLAKKMTAYLGAEGVKEALNEVATEEVSKSPVHKAIAEGLEVGFNIKEVTEMIGKEATDRLSKAHRGIVKKNGNADLLDLASENNFDSIEDMIESITQAETTAKAIQTKTKELVAQKEKEISNNLAYNESVKDSEHLNNKESLPLLIAEYELLSKKLTQEERAREKKANAKIYKEVALETLMKKTTKLAGRYDLYAKTEQKFANLSYKLAKDGKYEKAAEAKKKQILNHVMVQESIKLRDFKRDAEARYKTKVISKKIEKIENDYANIVADLIHKYGLNDKITPSLDKIPDLQDIDEAAYDQTPEWISTGFSPSGGLTYKEMTIGEFMELDASIKAIMHAGRGSLLSLEGDVNKTIQEAINESLDSMSQLKDKSVDPEHSDKKGLYGRFDQKVVNAKEFISNALADIVMYEYLMEELDNFSMNRKKEFGVLRRFFNRGRRAESEFKDILKNTTLAAQPHWDTLTAARKRIEASKGKAFKLESVPIPEILGKKGKDKWTVEKLVSLLLNTGNAHNLEVVMNSYGMTVRQLQEISGLFTASELQAIQGIWDVTDVLFEPLDQKNFNIHNRHLEKVDAEAITLVDSSGKNVKLAGGYYPLSFDRSISDVAELQQENDMMKDRNKAVLRSSKPKDGMAKKRGATHTLPPLLSLSVWQRHIADTARYISHAEYLRDLNKLSSNAEFKEMFEAKAGHRLYKTWRENIKFQARPERQVDGKFEKFLDTNRAGATGMILGLNMSVALKQRLSGLSAQADLGGTWILDALRDADLKGSVLGLSTSHLWTEVTEKSAYLRAREGNMDRELSDVASNMSPFIDKIKMPGLEREVSGKDVKDAAFFLINLNDRAMTGIVWKAAYNKSLHGNVDKMTAEEAEVAAIDFADSIAATTQPSNLPLDLSHIQRSEGAMRLFTAFSSWTFKQHNRFRHKHSAWVNGAISNKEYSEHIILELFMAPWGATIIGSLLASGELPEWWEMMTSPAEYAISGVPLLRDVPGVIKYDNAVGTSTAFEAINRHVQTGVSAFDWASGDVEYHKFLMSLGYSMEAMSGIPAIRTAKNMKRTYEIFKGEYEPRKK
jgi:hypothetical protein